MVRNKHCLPDPDGGDSWESMNCMSKFVRQVTTAMVESLIATAKAIGIGYAWVCHMLYGSDS